MDEINALIEKAKSEFKRHFDYELDVENDISIESDGIEVSYDDCDTSRLEDYQNNPMIECVRIGYDGRDHYIRVYAHLCPGDI